jgi:hypothetical protein
MPPTQPSTADRYSRVADLYKRALAEADQSDDPAAYRARAQAAYDKKVRQIAESEQESRQAATARPAAAAAQPARKRPSPSATAFALKTGVSPESLPEARVSPRVLNVLSGIPLAEEAAGVVAGLMPGGMTYQQGRQAAARRFREAEQETGGLEAAVERAVPMAVATKGMSLLPMAGRTIAGEALRGFGAAGTGEGEAAPTLRERLGAATGTGAAAGGGIALVEGALRFPGALRALGAPAARAIGRKFPNARDVVEGIGEGAASLARRPLRAASTALQERAPAVEAFMARQGVSGAGAGVRWLAEMIEPRDMTRILRQAEQALPGSPTGPTAASLGADIGPLQAAETAARASLGGARVEAAQSQLATQRAQAARQQAAAAAESQVGAVREAGRTRVSAAQQQREAAAEAQRLAEEAAYNRVQQQAQAGSAAIRGAKQQAEAITTRGAERQARLAAEQEALTPQLRAAKAASKQAAREAAEAELNALRSEAEQQVGGLVGGTRGTTSTMQDAIRARQKEVGEQTYAQVRAVPAPEVPPMDVYGDILSDPAMSSAFNQAVTRVEREAGQALPRLQIGEEAVPTIDLQVMDEMRRSIVDRIPLGPNVTGLSASQRRALLNQIDNLEKRFLASYGDDAAAQALKTARGQYRQEFQRLEALRDGLGFGTVGTGKASGLITQSRKELDAFEKNLRALEGGDAFQQELAELTRAGARESFDRLMQRTPGGALGMARKLTETEEGRRKVALVFGEDGLNAMLAFSKEATGQRAKAAASKAAAKAEEIVARLSGRAERLGALSSRAEQQAKARAAETVSTTRTAMQEALEQVKQQERATVVPLRQATRAARRTVGAEAGQARMGVLQARQAARQGVTPLREAFEQARGETFAARERRNALQAALVGATEARQAAQAQSASAQKIGGALGGREQAQEFLATVAPNMSPAERQRMREVIGSVMQRKMMDMDPKQTMRYLETMRNNPLVKQEFGSDVEALLQSLQRPSPVRTGAQRARVLLTGQGTGNLFTPR